MKIQIEKFNRKNKKKNILNNIKCMWIVVYKYQLEKNLRKILKKKKISIEHKLQSNKVILYWKFESRDLTEKGEKRNINISLSFDIKIQF